MKRIFTFIFFLFTVIVSAQKGKLLTPMHGLSNTCFYGFAQEKDGPVWIATENGLNKFDGFNFTAYFSNPSDSNSLSSNLISSLFLDSDDRLWIGTNGNLFIYNRQKDNFSVFRFIYRKTEFNLEITSICEDSRKNLWLTSSAGLIRIDLKTRQAYFCNINDANYQNFTRDLYNCATVDDKDNIWIGTDEHGLLMFSQKEGRFKTFCNTGFPVLCNGSVISVGKDQAGNILIGTLNDGLFRFNMKENTFAKMSLSEGESLDGAVYSIAGDKNGNVWIGTERNGLKIIRNNRISDANELIYGVSTSDKKVRCFPDRTGNLWVCIDYTGIFYKNMSPRPFYGINKYNLPPWQINHDIVKSIYADHSQNLWIGTDGGGLNRLNLKTGQSKLFKYQNKNGCSMPDNAVIAIATDKDHDLWVGTYLGGLSLFEPRSETFHTFLIDPSNRNRSINFVSTIAPDSSGNLWVGTNGGGLWYFDKRQKKFFSSQHLFLNRKRIELPLFITTLLIDRSRTLWIGSYNGLFAVNESTGMYKAITRNNSILTDEAVLALYEDTRSNIWLGTRNGLFMLDRMKNTLKGFYTENGLSSNSVSGILEDNNGNLWISTLNGLNKLSADRKKFENFSTYDGLPGNEFRPSSCFRDSHGILYFGSTTGVVFFHPDSIRDSHEKPKLVFTRLKLFNEEVEPGKEVNDHVILSQSLGYTRELTFRYPENNFTIEFAAINYVAPEKIRYACMMEGFDRKKIIKDFTQRSATYTNLRPGTYTFKVWNTNIDGLWNEDYNSLIIHVQPPFWKTWWAFFIYLSIIMLVLALTRKLTLFRINMQNKLEIERLEREKLEELNQSKLNFFSNVSHEFRTPLTLILGPLERLRDSPLDNLLKKQIEMVYRNAHRLLRLVNLILDLQKVEKSEMNLKARKCDIVTFTREIVQSFEEMSYQKKISLHFKSDSDHQEAWFDPDKLDKVLFNLLSNAFKFTLKGGSVTVKIDTEDFTNYPLPLRDHIKITVTDTGKGIKEEYFQKIFERFYQIEEDDSELQLGTGIGLHLSRYLVQLHQGQIHVSSKEGEGTRFEVLIPKGCDHLKPGQIVTESVESVSKLPDETATVCLVTDSNGKPMNGKNGRKYKILVVEDDFDVRSYIRTELPDNYETMEALDGKEGLSMVHKHMPDLIISDVMMPNMDGIQFCKCIKTDIHTSHIPVILLTARTSMENRIEGLEAGADEYIPKPFHTKHLLVRIEKLIELRENLMNKFSKTVSFEAREMTLTSADERFLQKAMNLVKEKISNPDLNIEDMGTELGMSRVHLYRKLKAMTNLTPSEFVRTIRLKQAAYLLEQDKLNISEVAYAVGFSSHQYFTNCFQNYFSMSPTEYCMKAREEKLEKKL